MSDPPGLSPSANPLSEERRLSAGLYLVATPIGNLADITRRSVATLAACDAVACEDTRVTGRLMKHLGLSKPLWRYDDHASPDDRARLLRAVETKAIALVSDAGTPLVSDPGYRLVREARELGLPVRALPGPCAAVAALTVSGLPSDRFMFAGFLPGKDKARREMLGELAAVKATLVFYDTAPRLVRSLELIAELWPARECAVARELTKLFEECRTGSARSLAQHYGLHPPKGEIVLLVAPPASEADMPDAEAMLREALADASPSQAAAQVARSTGLDRRSLYDLAMRLRRP